MNECDENIFEWMAMQTGVWILRLQVDRDMDNAFIFDEKDVWLQLSVSVLKIFGGSWAR